MAWPVAGRRVERADERHTSFGGSRHGVVGGEYEALRTELAVVPLVVLANNEEGVEDVLGVVGSVLAAA